MELLQLQDTVKKLPPKFQEELFHFADYLLIKSKKEFKTNLTPEKKQRGFGCMKDLVISIADDFDTPINELKDYV